MLRERADFNAECTESAEMRKREDGMTALLYPISQGSGIEGPQMTATGVQFVETLIAGQCPEWARM
jgi:hypothetical protein